MSEIFVHPSLPITLPAPRVAVSVRLATLDDLSFVDSLQRKHTRQVGWMPTGQLEGKLRARQVLVAETGQSDNCSSNSAVRIGYLIGQDQYFKRDDTGIIYQINVAPAFRRSLVAATLLCAQFDRSAYGCKLYCCWCAQDIEANRFWESCGFVPLAFRTGSEKNARVHIFWQKRIRQGDETTPWWFPSQTSGGSIREDRIVLPIPLGTHWSDTKPMVLPNIAVDAEAKALPSAGPRNKAVKEKCEPVKTIKSGGLRFAPSAPKPAIEERPKREPKRKTKNDPRLVAAARELRDRWLEQVNAKPLLPCGKYNVSRQIEDRSVQSTLMMSMEAPVTLALVATVAA